jgi:hypothetical protein
MMDDVCDRFTSEPYAMPRRRAEPFFVESLPCEACGRPAERREWNAEHQLMIGVGCACTEPDEPVCPVLERSILACRNVREIVSACREHREYCPMCKPVERKEITRAGDSKTHQEKRAA